MSFVVGAVATAIELGTVAAIATAVTYVGVAMTVVGTITKSKELTKIGGVLSIAGGVASLGAAAAGSFGSAATAGGAGASGAGVVGEESLWNEAASQAAGDTAANAAIDGANATTLDGFSGAAKTTADSAIGAADGIGSAAPDLATQYEITAGGGTLEPASTFTAAPKPTGLVGASGPTPEGLVGQATTPSLNSAYNSDSLDKWFGGLAENQKEQVINGAGVAKPGIGESLKSWFDKLPSDAKSRITTAALQVGGQAIGGLYQAKTNEKNFDFQKNIYDTSMRNASSVPVIQFKPVGLVNNATKGG